MSRGTKLPFGFTSTMLKAHMGLSFCGTLFLAVLKEHHKEIGGWVQPYKVATLLNMYL